MRWNFGKTNKTIWGTFLGRTSPLLSLCTYANHSQFEPDQTFQTNYLPMVIYLFKVNARNTRTRCEVCSKLIIKTPDRSFWCLYCNFEHTSYLVLVLLLLTLGRLMVIGLVFWNHLLMTQVRGILRPWNIPEYLSLTLDAIFDFCVHHLK